MKNSIDLNQETVPSDFPIGGFHCKSYDQPNEQLLYGRKRTSNVGTSVKLILDIYSRPKEIILLI